MMHTFDKNKTINKTSGLHQVSSVQLEKEINYIY